MRVRFALLSEGTSEWGLVPHLEALCVRAGAAEAIGTPADLRTLRRPPGKSTAARLGALVELMPEADFICVHRDADNVGVEPRRHEIEAAARQTGARVVPIIPVTMLEAWLLTDPDALFGAVGRPRGRARLDVPKVARLESIADPKALLKRLLAQASGASGRRLAQVNRDFSNNRAWLVEQIDIDGPITRLSAWRAMVADLTSVVQTLAS